MKQYNTILTRNFAKSYSKAMLVFGKQVLGNFLLDYKV